MTREEAIEVYNGLINTKIKEAFEFFAPELRESNDERIRKDIIGGLIWLRDNLKSEGPRDNNLILPGFCLTVGEHLKYLEKQKEKNGEDEECTDFTIYHPLKNGKGKYECIPYSFYGSLTSFSEDKDLIDFFRTCFYTEKECNEWIEQQKEQKPELVQHPPITFTYNSNASRDERLKAALLALLNSDLLKIKEGGYFTKQDLIEWVERIPTDKPAEWSEEDERILKGIIGKIDHDQTYGVSKDEMLNFLKRL